jgi:hypothetical protein
LRLGGKETGECAEKETCRCFKLLSHVLCRVYMYTMCDRSNVSGHVCTRQGRVAAQLNELPPRVTSSLPVRQRPPTHPLVHSSFDHLLFFSSSNMLHSRSHFADKENAHGSTSLYPKTPARGLSAGPRDPNLLAAGSKTVGRGGLTGKPGMGGGDDNGNIKLTMTTRTGKGKEKMQGGGGGKAGKAGGDEGEGIGQYTFILRTSESESDSEGTRMSM